MTSWAKIKIKGRDVLCKMGGYTGKTETKDPIRDIMTANRLWVDKGMARYLGLKIGDKVRMEIAGKPVSGRVYKWSRGSRMIVFDKPFRLSRAKAERIHVDLD